MESLHLPPPPLKFISRLSEHGKPKRYCSDMKKHLFLLPSSINEQLRINIMIWHFCWIMQTLFCDAQRLQIHRYVHIPAPCFHVVGDSSFYIELSAGFRTLLYPVILSCRCLTCICIFVYLRIISIFIVYSNSIYVQYKRAINTQRSDFILGTETT